MKAKSFYSDSMALVFRDGEFVLDFRKSIPIIEGSEGEKKVSVEHQPIIVSPEAAKRFKNLLEHNIEKYEEKYGGIELKNSEKEDSQPDESHDYIA